MIKKRKNNKRENKKSKKEKDLNKKIDILMKNNFKEYQSKEELESFIENRYKNITKEPMKKINEKEKEIHKRLKEKEKENEKLANEKVKTGQNKLKENLKTYIKKNK